MELVDENEGYYDEEGEEVVDFMQGEQMPTFSLNKVSPQQQQPNERAKQYSQPPAETGTTATKAPTASEEANNAEAVEADLRQVLNDPYLCVSTTGSTLTEE